MKDALKKMIKKKKNIIEVSGNMVPDEYKSLKKQYKKNPLVSCRGYTFLIKYNAGGGIGMGEYPPNIRVYMLYNFNTKDEK